MSRSISLNIKIDSSENIPFRKIIEIFINMGWNPISNNLINYLPLGDNDMFDWIAENKTIDQLYDIIDLKDKQNEIIGIDLFWQNSDTGIVLLISRPNEIAINFDINRRYINKDIYLIDFNWYSEKILIGLSKAFYISYYNFEFIY